MKIVVINQPFGNRGDEAAHRALIREINKRSPEVKVDIAVGNLKEEGIDQIAVKYSNNKYVTFGKCSYKGYKYVVKTLHRFPNLYWLWNFQPISKAMLKAIKKADIVINAPGGICMGGFMNWTHVTQLAMADYAKKPIVYFCRSIGPFSQQDSSHKLFTEVSLRLLKSFKYISLRDKKSQELADSLNVSHESTTDAAFLDDTHVEIPTEIANQLSGKKYVVFVPNSLKWHYYFKDKSKSLIDKFYLDIIEQYSVKLMFNHLKTNELR